MISPDTVILLPWLSSLTTGVANIVSNSTWLYPFWSNINALAECCFCWLRHYLHVFTYWKLGDVVVRRKRSAELELGPGGVLPKVHVNIGLNGWFTNSDYVGKSVSYWFYALFYALSNVLIDFSPFGVVHLNGIMIQCGLHLPHMWLNEGGLKMIQVESFSVRSYWAT